MMDIPGYTIIRELGRGGMATVYLAKQDRLGRKVALKVMQPLPNGVDDFTARFIKEGRIIAQLQHPKIVTIYDFDIVEGYHYFSMEYLPNGTLSDAIRKGMSVEQAVTITRGIAEALAVAHDHGVIHRDIKPQNVLFRADGTPVLTDFGIARAAGAGADATQVTNFGMIIGSPRYMSPEQSQSKPVDARSDLYSLGVAFYEMLTRELPYQADDVVSLAMKHCTAPIPVLHGPLQRYQPILEKLLAKRPEDRFGSAQDLIRALDRVESGDPIDSESRPDATRVVTPTRDKPASEARPRASEDEPPAQARLPLPVLAAAVVAVLAAGLSLAWYLLAARDDEEPVALELPEATGPRSEGARNYERLAFEHFAVGQFRESLQVLELALSQFPNDARLLTMKERSEAELDAQRFQREAQRRLDADALDEAEQLISAGLQRLPGHPGLLTLSTQLEKRRRQKNAERAASLKQGAEQALSQGNLSESMRLVQDALELVPDDSGAKALASRVEAALAREKTLAQLIEQAKGLMADDLLPRALAVINEGLADAPQHPELNDLKSTVTEQLQRAATELAETAESAARDGRYQDAYTAIRKALQLAPDDAAIRGTEEKIRAQQRQASVEALFKRAREALAERRLQEALELAEEGLGLQPDNLGLFTFREIIRAEVASADRIAQAAQQIRSRLSDGELDQALSVAEQALQNDPQSSELSALRGEILAAQKQVKSEQVLELLRQASGLYREEDFDAALTLTQQGLALASDHGGLQSLQQRIEKAMTARAEREKQIRACGDLLAETIEASADIDVLASAGRCYQRLLQTDASNRLAQSRLGGIRSRLAERFDQLLDQGQVEAAARGLAALDALDLPSSRLTAMRTKLTTQLASIPRTASLSAGCFQIGTPDASSNGETDEAPARVCVDAFELALRETTVADFEGFVKATEYRTDAERGTGGVTGCYTLDLDSPGEIWAYHPWADWRTPNKYQARRGDLPVSCVSRNDALAYIQWLNQRTGQHYRLPTEAEWEYAARAGTTASRFWGEANDVVACDYANVADTAHDWDGGFPCDDGYEWAAPVGAYQPNPWGLHDILGNVSEWTCSTYESEYVGAEGVCATDASTDPVSLRGGAWNSGPSALRSAHRNRNYPESRYSFVGFRLVKQPLSD